MREVAESVDVGAPDSDVAPNGDPPPSPAVAAAVDGAAASDAPRNIEREGHAYYDGDDGSRWTVTEAIDASGFGRFQLMMLLFTGLAWMGDAMEMMLLSFLGPSVRCEWGISPKQEARLTSVVFLGMLFGAPTWGIVADARGRRVAFFATTTITFFAGLVSAVSPSFGFLLFARTLVGFGLGGVPTAFALFMEFLPAGNRGKWLVAIEVFWTLGSVVEAGFAWAILPTHSWRVLLLASTAPLALLLCVMWIIPESPYYLAAKGDAAGAAETLRRVSRANGLDGALPRGMLKTPAAVTSAFRVSRSIEHDAVSENALPDESARGRLPRRSSRGWRIKKRLSKTKSSLLKPFGTVAKTLNDENRTLTLMLWFVFFAVAFLYYGVVLLTTEIHLDASSNGEASPGSLEGGGVRGGDDSLRCTGHGSPDLPRRAFLDIFVSAVAELPGLAFCALALDALGRRRTLGSCLLIAAVCVLVLTGHREIAAVTEASALAAARCFAMAAFTALYVYAPETQTTATRATALGVGNAFARVGGMLTPLFAVEMVGNGNLEGVAACFAALAAVTAAVAFFLPVETAGRDLDADAADDTNAGDVELVETATDSSSPRVT